MQINLFAEETQLQKLTKLGDSLEKLNIIDFESFRPLLVSAARKERKNNAGRPAFDVVMGMFCRCCDDVQGACAAAIVQSV